MRLGASSFCRFRALERTIRALGENQTAALSGWTFAADSISAEGLFRDVVVLTVGLRCSAARRAAFKELRLQLVFRRVQELERPGDQQLVSSGHQQSRTTGQDLRSSRVQEIRSSLRNGSRNP
eukprot:9458187-Alexandrium_andersonii.AAC.1